MPGWCASTPCSSEDISPMNRPLEIGVTGGIGSGKSLVCRIFHCLGTPVYDADSRAKNLMTTEGILVEQIKKEFGTLSYLPDGTLDRTYLSKIAFEHPEKLTALNGLVHPRVAIDYRSWVAAHQGFPYIIREAALLFEAGANELTHQVIVVYADQDVRLKRIRNRDPHRTEAEIKKIMKSQWPDEEKMKKADEVIYNNDQQAVIPQVLRLHEKFRGKKNHPGKH